MRDSGAAIAFCPTSNLFLGSGLFSLDDAREFDIRVGLATDVGAGTSFSLLQTMAEAYKVCQLAGQQLTPLKAFYLATLGGAEALGRPECGVLAPGKRADIAVWDTAGIAAAGSWDAVAALVLCGPFQARDVVVEGRRIVEDGRLATIDLAPVIQRARRLARDLAC